MKTTVKIFEKIYGIPREHCFIGEFENGEFCGNLLSGYYRTSNGVRYHYQDYSFTQ